MSSAKPIPHQGGYVWDEHRNSSRVFPVPPTALPEAQRALATLDPELRAWITDGAQTMTEAEHVARFGEMYVARRSKKVRA